LQSTAAWAKEKMEKAEEEEKEDWDCWGDMPWGDDPIMEDLDELAEEEEKEDKCLTKPPPVSSKTTTGELNYLNYIYT
jgi:hypothetical protein